MMCRRKGICRARWQSAPHLSLLFVQASTNNSLWASSGWCCNICCIAGCWTTLTLHWHCHSVCNWSNHSSKNSCKSWTWYLSPPVNADNVTVHVNASQPNPLAITLTSLCCQAENYCGLGITSHFTCFRVFWGMWSMRPEGWCQTQSVQWQHSWLLSPLLGCT